MTSKVSHSSPPTLLLTVGSTSFTPLVTSFLSLLSLPTFLSLLPAHILAQVGNSQLPAGFVIGKRALQDEKGREVILEIVKFMEDLEDQVGRAELVISHAGAGSILSFLRPSTTPSPLPPHRELILVPNDTLMDSHQSDLAEEMKKSGWATVCSPVELKDTLEGILSGTRVGRREEPPELDKEKVSKILDETLGFV